MHKKFRILFSLFTVLCLIFGITTSVYASGTVTYNADSDKFIFESGSKYSPTDLFSNFKGVMPGDSIKQNLTVKNESSNEVKVQIYIRSKQPDEASAELLSNLHLTVEKAQENKMEYMFDISANQPAINDWVCLGTLYSGGEVNLVLTLDVPIELDNKFQDAIGYLDWEFKVEEHPIEPDDPRPPQTGDNSIVYIIGLTASVSALAIVIVCYKRKNLI